MPTGAGAVYTQRINSLVTKAAKQKVVDLTTQDGAQQADVVRAMFHLALPLLAEMGQEARWKLYRDVATADAAGTPPLPKREYRPVPAGPRASVGREDFENLKRAVLGLTAPDTSESAAE